MEWSVGRWYVSIGTKGWHNYVSVGGVMGFLGIVVGHFQLVTRFYWKPRRPGFYMRQFFYRVLDSPRWTSHELGIDTWPIIVGFFWRATCYGCVEEYSRDLKEYQRVQSGRSS